MGYGINLGFYNSIFIILEQLVHPVGYGTRSAGIFASSFTMMGLVSAVCTALLLDRTHAYKSIIRIVFVSTGIAMINFFLQLKPRQWNIVWVSTGLLGVVSLPSLPVVLPAAAEATFPVSEEVSTGLLMFAGNS